jgi:hypothetical protein
MSNRLQLKITLENIVPPIWRRVVVPEDITFKKLHDIIQRAFGWQDCHLHEFLVGKTRIGTRSGESFFDAEEEDIVPESQTTLAEALGGKKKFRYWYDFGDDWLHEIVIEKHLPPDDAVSLALLLDGERACPPEDCGGPWGYAELLTTLADPAHPEHEDMREWAGDFDPEGFKLGMAAEAVRKSIRRKKAKPQG